MMNMKAFIKNLFHLNCLCCRRLRRVQPTVCVVIQLATLAQLPQAHLRATQPQDGPARGSLAHPRVLLARTQLSCSGERRIGSILVINHFNCIQRIKLLLLITSEMLLILVTLLFLRSINILYKHTHRQNKTVGFWQNPNKSLSKAVIFCSYI